MTNPATNADDRTERNADRQTDADELDADDQSSPIFPDDRTQDARSDDQPSLILPDDLSADNLTAVVVERDVGPDECTIYPGGASDDDLVTEWMTAKEGSYVELESMR